MLWAKIAIAALLLLAAIDALLRLIAPQDLSDQRSGWVDLAVVATWIVLLYFAGLAPVQNW